MHAEPQRTGVMCRNRRGEDAERNEDSARGSGMLVNKKELEGSHSRYFVVQVLASPRSAVCF